VNSRWLRPVSLSAGASGKTRTPGATEGFWCRTEHSFQYAEPYYYSGQASYSRVGGSLALACEANGLWPR
jgi:hypothetical protein